MIITLLNKIIISLSPYTSERTLRNPSKTAIRMHCNIGNNNSINLPRRDERWVDQGGWVHCTL